MERMRETTKSARGRWLPWLAAGALLAAAYAYTLRWLWLTWMGSPYYGHGLLVPLVAGGIAWRLEAHAHAAESERGDVPHAAGVQTRMDAAPGAPPLSLAGIAWVATAIGSHLWATRAGAVLFSAVSLVLAIAGVVLTLGGAAALQRHAFPLAFLVLMIPIPWLETLSPALARWTARTAGDALAALGGEVVVSGARLSLPQTELVVGAPCSGVNSLAALSTLAVLYAFLVQGPLAARVGLALLSVPIALAANWARVAILLALAHWVSAEVALGYFHDWSGALLFGVAMALLYAASVGLRCSGIRSDI